MAIKITSVAGGTNSVVTTATDKNNDFTDFLDEGIVGAIADATPDTGGYAIQAQGTPDKTVKVKTGTMYILATPTGGTEQMLRSSLTSDTNVTIADNTSGATKYDKVLVRLSGDNLVNPPTDNDWSGETGSDEVLITERHDNADETVTTSNAYELAEITVANGFTSIANAVIADSRSRTKFVYPIKNNVITKPASNYVKDVTGLTSAAYADLTDVTMTFTPEVTSSCFITFNTDTYTTAGAGAAAWISFQVVVDGVAKVIVQTNNFVAADGYHHPVGLSYVATGLDASAHTIKIQYRQSGATWAVSDATLQGILMAE